MNFLSSSKIIIWCGFLLILGATTSCYRAPIAQRTLAPTLDYGLMGFEALGEHTGAVIILDPQYGRVLKRVARGMDAQFSTSPFEVIQVVTAYAALDAGIITPQTKFKCSATEEPVNVEEALSRACPNFFAELGNRVPPESFKRAAQVIGFTYYGTEALNNFTTAMRPITAVIPSNISGADYQALTTHGTGMKANDLHFAQLAISLASSTTTSERMSTIITTTSQAVAPPPVPINKQALEIIRHGLVKSVEEGTAMAAGTVKQAVAGKVGSNEENALFLSFAPADKPQIGLIVFLKEGTGTEAAQVAGKFYRSYFKK